MVAAFVNVEDGGTVFSHPFLRRRGQSRTGGLGGRRGRQGAPCAGKRSAGSCARGVQQDARAATSAHCRLTRAGVEPGEACRPLPLPGVLACGSRSQICPAEETGEPALPALTGGCRTDRARHRGVEAPPRGGIRACLRGAAVSRQRAWVQSPTSAMRTDRQGDWLLTGMSPRSPSRIVGVLHGSHPPGEARSSRRLTTPGLAPRRLQPGTRSARAAGSHQDQALLDALPDEPNVPVSRPQVCRLSFHTSYGTTVGIQRMETGAAVPATATPNGALARLSP